MTVSRATRPVVDPDARRVALLTRIHWLVVGILAVLIAATSVVLAWHIRSAAEHDRRSDAVAESIVGLRDEMQTLLVTYWRGYAIGGGGPAIPAELTTRYLTATVGLTEILNARRNAPGEAGLIERVRAAMVDLTRQVSSDTSRLRNGTPAAAAFRAKTERRIDVVEVAVEDWFTQIERTNASEVEAAETTTTRLMILLAGLVAAVVLVALAFWLVIDRARKAALARVSAQRDANRVVMASVQDGLAVVAVNGTITDVNDRLCELIRRSRTSLIGGPAPWAEQVSDGARGEIDLHGPAAPAGRILSISASPLAHGTGSLHVVRDITEARRRDIEARNAAVEQEALRRVATFVAAGSAPAQVFELVAREIALMVGAQVGIVVRFDPLAERAINVGVWLRPESPVAEVPTRIPLDGGAPVAEVFRVGEPVRVDDLSRVDSTTAGLFGGHGIRSGVAAPVKVGSERWGAVAALTGALTPLDAGAEDRLARFAELVELTVANAEARARLASQAATDPLTGLANHRTFHERLVEEADRARGHGDELSLVMIDLDRFKDVNDAFGHQVGDGVLAEAARRLAAEARSGELVARVGGEEFAWIMPGTDGINAWRAAERARRAVAARPFPGGVGTVTASAGVADLTQANDAAELVRHADGALYWAKASGRNATLRYSPQVVRELSAAERAERLDRSQAVTALRALARAVDAKDPSTARHAERVAAVAMRIGAELGWDPRRLEQLEEAALLHDVGKIGVPDALLFKTDRLAPREMREVEAHAVLGAEIVSDVLTAEQVRWVRGHHERWDGRGYPDGLGGAEISDGAAILAVADSWDAMTSVRLYGTPRSFLDAVAEARRCSGTHFSPDVVTVLEKLMTEGRLTLTDVRYPGEPREELDGEGDAVSLARQPRD